uniref:Phosphatidic acid phosphatase type 2/haloperoxidase domain-containing protein n=1 Tax=Erythrolobus australicus TaxID=1077150 RepID=A0A7S1TKD4_9RHOD|mmetsp:Transcript_2297/g.6223  ORF Transcript_2297/g.6223 Transcript_2297/m.6223 type:complete len:446 (+) Transcript_2297:257-1594(+)
MNGDGVAARREDAVENARFRGAALRKVASWGGSSFSADACMADALACSRRLDSDDSIRSVSPLRNKDALFGSGPEVKRTQSTDGDSGSPTSHCSSVWDPLSQAPEIESLSFRPVMSSKESSMTLLDAASGNADKEYLECDDVLRFSVFWEAVLEPFDEPLLRACQRKTKGVVYAFSFLLTFCTAVEAGLNWPVVLYTLGMDRAARTFSLMLLTLSVASQIPKRYIWRPRPWMVGRARKIRGDKTSSFPSRAAACALVFPLLVLKALKVEFGITVSPVAQALVVSACILSAGFARINVGAHYPSDIIAGVGMGMLVWWCGSALESVFGFACRVAATLIASEVRLLFAVIFSFVTTHVFLERFWAKCSFVFGLLLASLTHDFAFLPVLEPVSVTSQSWPRICGKAVVGLLLLGYGMKAHKKKGAGWQMAVFAQMYLASLAILMLFRF